MPKKKIYNLSTTSLCILSLILVKCTPAFGTSSSIPFSDSRLTITFAALYGLETQYEHLIDKFEAQTPDIDVQLIMHPGNSPNLEDLVQEADTLLLGSTIPTEQAHLFLDLAPLMSASGFPVEALWPGALQGCQVGDKQKGLPVSLSPRLVFYNKDVLEQAGLTAPQAGWSWDDFRTVAEALADPDEAPPRYGFIDSALGSLLSPLIDTLLESGTDSAGLSDGLQWYVDLARSGAIAVAGEMPQDSLAIIKNGQAAMWVGTLSTLVYDWQGLDFEVGTAPFPADPQVKTGTTINVTCGAISAGSSQPAASWAWLDYLSRNLPSEATYFSVTRFDALETSNYWQNVSPQTGEVARYALEYGWYGWVNSDFSAIREALQTSIATDRQLSSLLPEEPLQVTEKTSPLTAENTPVLVSPPLATPSRESSNEANVLSAVYFADRYYHTSLRDVIALADTLNRSHPDMHIEIETKRIGFENIYSNIYDVDNFDCFASSGAVIVPPINGSTTYSDFTAKVYTLDPLLETLDTSLLDELNPILLDAVSLDGTLYGLPVAIQPYVVFYNATLLQELGLDPPGPGWTVEDFWNLAAQVSRARDDLYGYLPYNIEPFFFLSDTSYLDKSSAYPEANFSSPEIINLFNQLAPLAKARALFLLDTGGTRSWSGNYQQRDELMQFGLAGLWIDQVGMPSVSVTQPVNYEVGIAVLPFQQTLNPAYSTTLYISRRAQNPRVCWEWFRYLVMQPVSVFQGIPLRQSILDSENWIASVGRQQAGVYRATMLMLQIRDEIDLFIPFPLTQWWADALVAILQEGQDAAVVLQAIQYKAQATLDCMKAAGISPSIPSDEQYDTAVSCAHKADPNYYSWEDLWTDQVNP